MRDVDTHNSTFLLTVIQPNTSNRFWRKRIAPDATSDGESNYMDLPTIKEKLFAGSVVGFLRIGLAIPVYLVMTPIILNTLGEERFGLWSFSTILISMLNLADFGFKNSLVYYVARQHEDKEAVSQHFAIATLLYLSVSSLIALVILFFHGEIIEKLLQVP